MTGANTDDELIVPNHPHADQRNWRPGDDDDGETEAEFSGRATKKILGAKRTLARMRELIDLFDAVNLDDDGKELAKFLVAPKVRSDDVYYLYFALEGVHRQMEKLEQPSQRKCPECGESLDGLRANAIYCESARCRQRAYRKRKGRAGKRSNRNKSSNVTDMATREAA
jgi:hypothetical protein